ncbi:MAG: AAA family ATPase [Steroidobacteraceae bacterium]|nr:AAA family ATPase [Steroidobacteraceae bacterium]
MAQLPEQFAGLLQPGAYPHPVSAVTLVQTHVSWVLLTGEYAYKIKRPVRYPFVDLTSAERRAFFCAEEVRLNRRFAPDLYLDVCDITERNGLAAIGGTGRVLERCVHMRQFPPDQELDRLLARDAIGTESLDAFGRELARIHERLPVPRPDEPWGRAEGVAKVLTENVESYAAIVAEVTAEQARRSADADPDPLSSADDSLSSIEHALTARLRALTPLISARRDAGRVRECHGDLHSRNVVWLQNRLVAFDCMEFEPAFRWIDVAEEIAFLIADLEAHDRPAHAHAFLTGYLDVSGDFEACRVLDLYKAHRALVRAKVAALEVKGLLAEGHRNPQSASSAALEAMRRDHAAFVDVARRALQPRPTALILMSGLSGSGKTWLARQLAPAIGAIHVRSDVERKRAAGLGELASSRSALGRGLYAPGVTEQTYARLADVVEQVLSGGYPVIVDATFLRRAQRDTVTSRARHLGVLVFVVHCDAPAAVLKERIAARTRSGRDASEADLAVLEWQLGQHEPIGSGESLDVITVDTRDPNALASVTRHLESRGLTLRAAPRA